MFTIKVKSQDDKNKKEYNVEISNHGKTNVKGSKIMKLRGPKTLGATSSSAVIALISLVKKTKANMFANILAQLF